MYICKYECDCEIPRPLSVRSSISPCRGTFCQKTGAESKGSAEQLCLKSCRRQRKQAKNNPCRSGPCQDWWLKSLAPGRSRSLNQSQKGALVQTQGRTSRCCQRQSAPCHWRKHGLPHLSLEGRPAQAPQSRTCHARGRWAARLVCPSPACTPRGASCDGRPWTTATWSWSRWWAQTLKDLTCRSRSGAR